MYVNILKYLIIYELHTQWNEYVIIQLNCWTTNKRLMKLFKENLLI